MAEKSMWTCPECTTRSLLVTAHQYCPVCGAEQTLEACYVPSDAEQRTALDHPFVGRELACLACQTLNSRTSNNCGGCGCSLAGARELSPPAAAAGRSSASRSSMSRPDMSSSVANGSVAGASRSAAQSRAGMSSAGRSSASLSTASLARVSEISRRNAEQDARRSKRRNIVVLAALATMGLIYLLNTRKDTSNEVRVLGHEWSRVIEIEQFREVVENGPCNAIPLGAKLISDRGSNQCAYRFSEWQVVREAVNSGEGTDSPRAWPEYRLRWTGSGDCPSCEREGQRIELFLLRVAYRGRNYSCEVEPEMWESMAVGATLIGLADEPSGALDCATLTAAP